METPPWCDDEVDPEGLSLLNAAQDGNATLLRACLQGQPQLALSARAPRYDDECPEWTSLMFVASQGHAECVSLLLEAHDPEAQVMAADSHGLTALMLAADGGHAECVRLLLAAHDPGAQVMATSSSGWTALGCAADGGCAQCVRLLLEAHDPRAQAAVLNTHGWTALMSAVDSGSVECVRLLAGLYGHSPRSLSKALRFCTLGLLQQPEWPECADWCDCIKRLLQQGAALPVEEPRLMVALEPILHDLLQEATSSDCIYEALLLKRPVGTP